MTNSEKQGEQSISAVRYVVEGDPEDKAVRVFAVVGTVQIGSITVKNEASKDQAHPRIASISVASEWQRQGIALEMARRAVDQHPFGTEFVWVQASLQGSKLMERLTERVDSRYRFTQQ